MLEKWVPELRHYAPLVPVVLVGTKMGNYAFILLDFTNSVDICDGVCLLLFNEVSKGVFLIDQFFWKD